MAVALPLMGPPVVYSGMWPRASSWLNGLPTHLVVIAYKFLLRFHASDSQLAVRYVGGHKRNVTSTLASSLREAACVLVAAGSSVRRRRWKNQIPRAGVWGSVIFPAIGRGVSDHSLRPRESGGVFGSPPASVFRKPL